MSLIMFVETNAGLVLAGDSRLSRKLDANWHRDDVEKVFECKNKVGIAYHGEADINGEPMEKIIKDFIATVSENDTVEKILEHMQEYIKSKGMPKTKFYIFGYEKNKKKIYKFDISDSTVNDMSDNIHGTGGDDTFAWNALRGKSDIHRTNEEAVSLINQLFQTTMEKVDTVGGAIDILLISNNDGIKWIKHK